MAVIIANTPHAFVLSAFLTASRLCFFNSITSKRPKSFSDRLFCTAARRVAHALLSHFSMMASFSSCFLRTPDPAARGRLLRRRGVRVRCL